ncbi:MAG: DUF2809 domain-containing protein [Verrucomicrobiae bacterium]|nr:DUF2809 domain-containing protein [Verrucomicrobiae bacterium]
MRRPRCQYAGIMLLVIAAGLGSRTGWARTHLPEFVSQYAGDTLWALTLFLALGWAFPAARGTTLALTALGLSFAVEFSQLYQAPWIVQIRETLPGRLLLGSGFLWTDLICYSVGIALGWWGERWWSWHRRHRSGKPPSATGPKAP